MPRSLLACLALSGLLAGCAAQAPMLTANDQRCEQFAHSGGYPFLEGGSLGSNSTLIRLPGAPPQWLGGIGQPGVTQHLDEEDYLRRWCLANLI